MLGIGVGRLAGDAVRESVGWWGSLGVGTLAAMIAALVVFFVIHVVRRRGQARRRANRCTYHGPNQRSSLRETQRHGPGS